MELHYIELLGDKQPMCFSMTAAQNLTRHFGSIEEMGEQLMNEDVSIRRDAINDALAELIRAGRAYAKAKGDPLPPELPCAVADVVGPETVPLVTLILNVLKRDSAREVEIEETGKNGGATPGA